MAARSLLGSAVVQYASGPTEDVGGFQVPVKYALVMGRGQAGAELPGDLDAIVPGQPTDAPEEVASGSGGEVPGMFGSLEAASGDILRYTGTFMGSAPPRTANFLQTDFAEFARACDISIARNRSHDPTGVLEDLADWEGGERVPLSLSAWPNPTSGVSTIRFAISGSGPVRLSIHDVSGRLVRELVRDELVGGPYIATWDGRDTAGHQVAAGMFFYRLESVEGAQTRRVVLVR